MEKVIGKKARELPIKEAAQYYKKVTGHGLVALNGNTDTHWSSPCNAMDSTTTVGSTDTNKVLGREHIQRARNREKKYNAFYGSSKAMEGFALKKHLKEQYEDKVYFGCLRVYFTTLTSDHDSTTGSIFKEATKRIFQSTGYDFIDPTQTKEGNITTKQIEGIITSAGWQPFIDDDQPIEELYYKLSNLDDTNISTEELVSQKLFATQLFDAGHKSKNVKKNISKLAKGFGKECARMYKKIVSVKNTNHLSREESMILC